MEYTEYTFCGGRCSLTLPVFLGEDDACRMNGFYSHALDTIREYGESLTAEDRRSSFFCSPEITEKDGILTVTLHLTYRRAGMPSVRKTPVHRWRGGFLLRGKQ